MAEQVLIQFRVDRELKQDVSDICEALGIDMPTVFRMCMKQMKITRGIPFSTKLPYKPFIMLVIFHFVKNNALYVSN